MKIKKKVWKTGGSLCVLIPNFWTTTKNIKEKDYVYIEVNENNNLVISTSKK